MSAGLSAVGAIGWAVDRRIFTLMSSLTSLTSRDRQRLRLCILLSKLQKWYQFSKTLDNRRFLFT